MTLYSYLPQDRVQALARGETLPDRTTGSALFADISGFTALTEALRKSLGARQGGEELSRHLNRVYTALINEVERFGGSVISFAGDAITCWFDDAHGVAAPRAVQGAFALQQAMQPFAAISLPNNNTTALSLKVAVATGSARRFLVGDPSIHYLDALAGATVERTAVAEHLANKGEILLDETTIQILGDTLTIQEWRTDPDSEQRFAIVSQFTPTPEQLPLLTDHGSLNIENWPSPPDLRPFLLPAVYERELAGQASFLTEFRPCAVLFVRFEGIDYEADESSSQLDVFIRTLQASAERYEGTILQLAIGDKGSYAYLNFGALAAHEDDVRRAVKTALTLQANTTLQLQIGITYGLMRVGAYGGKTRQTYGALGDDVNLSARLMTTAAPGEILLSSQAHKATQNEFTFEPHPPLSMKGKSEPLPVFTLTGARQRRAVRLQEPTYALPMVGRQEQLQTIEAKLTLAAAGQSQVIGIVADAGLGKSRLVAEAIRSARKKDFVGYGGACQSDGIHTPYLTWKSIWQAFFDVDPAMPLRRLIRWLEGEIEDRAPSRVDALPLLGPLLDLNIPENEFTKGLEPKIRQNALHALLEECLKAASQEEPTLIVLEDLHWIDALSYELLEQLVKALVNFPICFVLAYRPPQMERLQEAQLESLPGFTKIELRELNQSEAEQAIRAKLAQLYPARSGAVPPKLVEKLMARAQGNPFYLEELLNYLRDRGLDPRDPADLERIELPNSLHTLILSRIDQLTESEKTTLRVASIIGRLFRVRWLTGYYPDLGNLPQVKADLDELHTLDITPLDSPEPELAYLFKHIVTHEVTYESLQFATRAKLHEQLAHYLEQTFPDNLPLEALAFHYGHSENPEKALRYYTLAGDAAFQLFALDGALSNYKNAIAWADRGKAGAQKIIHLYRRWGRILELLLRFEEALEVYQALEALGEAQSDDTLRLAGLVAQGIIYGYGLKEFEKGRQRSEEALSLAQKLGDKRAQARSLWNLMAVMIYLDPMNALAYGESGLVIARELAVDPQATNEDREQLALILLDFFYPLVGTGQMELARERTTEALTIFEQMGNRPMVATVAQRVGFALREEGKFEEAEAVLRQSIEADRSIGNEGGVVDTSGILLDVYSSLGDFTSYFAVYEAAKPLALRKERGVSLEMFELLPVWIYSHFGAIQQVQLLKNSLLQFNVPEVPFLRSMFLAYAVLTCIRAGDLKTSQELLDKIDTDDSPDNFLIPLAHLLPQIKAEWALATGELLDEALADLRGYLEKIDKNKVWRYMPIGLLLKGRILRANGRSQEAFATLHEAHKLAIEQKTRPALWQICAQLAEMEAERGNLAASQEMYKEARSAIDFIAEHAGRDDLRTSFLAMAQVQSVLENTR